MEKLGLLAGIGTLPVECAQAAKRRGYEVYAVALVEETDPRLRDYADHYEKISVLKIGKILKYLKKNGIHKVTMLGKVTKEVLFARKSLSNLPDVKALQILWQLPDRKDDTIMNALVAELQKIGAEPLDQTELIRDLMPEKGVLTQRQPTEAERKDMEYGFRMAKELGRLDIGQTVVIKDMAVMALEAIEGTDACIRRGGQLAKSGAVVVKVAKPQQDSRFDVPTVGLTTIESMVAVDAKALAIEAKATLLAEREQVLAMADQHGITIVAI